MVARSGYVDAVKMAQQVYDDGTKVDDIAKAFNVSRPSITDGFKVCGIGQRDEPDAESRNQ